MENLDNFEKYLETLKTGKTTNDFCINEALNHVKQIKDVLHAREHFPQSYYKDSMNHTRWMMKVMPIVYALGEANCTYQLPVPQSTYESYTCASSSNHHP
jgi:hypothetical protein